LAFNTNSAKSSHAGYQASHVDFRAEMGKFRKKSFIQAKGETITVKCQLGVLLDGAANIKKFGVCSLLCTFSSLVLTRPLQKIESIDLVDAHIGLLALHTIVHNALQPSWTDYCKGFGMPLPESCELRHSSKIYKLLPGNPEDFNVVDNTPRTISLGGPKDRDCIYHEFVKKTIHKKGNTTTTSHAFKSSAIVLALCIDEPLYRTLLDHRADVDMHDDMKANGYDLPPTEPNKARSSSSSKWSLI
jgi:hypothetical protein